jgi:ATP-binding cassette subfamily F protein uup
MSLVLSYFKNLFLTFGHEPLFNNISAQINSKDRICLVGKNGSGKSTLLKILAKQIEADKGDVYFSPGIKIGYLAQTPIFNKDLTIYEYVIENIDLQSNESIEQKSYLADIVIENLKLPSNERLSNLSGGTLRRADLAKVLVAAPDLLLLDEPTNHLDISSIEWLEGYLNDFAGGLLVISHDRVFLRNISNKTIWLDRNKLLHNNKGYSDFERFRDEIFEQEARELSRLGKELDKENLWLQQGVTARRKRNQQRLHGLYDLREKLKSDKSRFNNIANSITIDQVSSNNKSKIIAELNNVSFNFAEKIILKPFSLNITKGEVIGVLGSNGAGKSTLVKLITGELKPTTGEIKLGTNLKYSLLDQSRDQLDLNATLWQELCPQGGDTVLVGDKTKHVVAYLKDFLFTSQQINSKVSILSGGEKNRLLLAKLLASPGNFLILDEPTNDLDIDTLDMLVDILSEYTGTLLIVSHDRDFLERLVTRTIVIDRHIVSDYMGGYHDYVSSIKLLKKVTKTTKEPIKQEKQVSNKLSYKDERELSLLPKTIDDLTTEIKKLEDKIADPDFYNKNPQEFNEISAKIEAKKSDLEKSEIRWLELEEKKVT